MMTAEETVENITGASRVEYVPSMDEAADAPKSMDVSVAAKTLASRGRAKMFKAGLASAAVTAVLLPLGMVASGKLAETVIVLLMK